MRVDAEPSATVDVVAVAVGVPPRAHQDKEIGFRLVAKEFVTRVTDLSAFVTNEKSPPLSQRRDQRMLLGPPLQLPNSEADKQRNHDDVWIEHQCFGAQDKVIVLRPNGGDAKVVNLDVWPNGFDLDPVNLYLHLRDAGPLTRAAAE